MENRTAFVRRKIILLSFCCRAAVVGCVLVFRGLHLLEDQFMLLGCLLLPLTCLYITIFTQFVGKNKYQRQGAALTGTFTGFGLATLLLLHFAELALIAWKSYDTTVLGSDELFYLLIAACESGLGIFAGIYLADLFNVES